MDVFKTRVGTVESIMITPESYMAATELRRPYAVQHADGRYSFYAVCPLCDNPISIVGLFKSQEGSRYRRPFGKHHPGDVQGLCAYDEDAYMNCPYANPSRKRRSRIRPPKNPTSLAIWRHMRDEFDHVAHAWETWSGIHLGPKLAGSALQRWRANKVWNYYGATYRNLPQMLFYGAPAQNLVKTYVVRSSPLRDALDSLPEVRLTPTPSPRYEQVDKTGTGFLSLDFHLTPGRSPRDGHHFTETFRLRVICEGREAFPDLELETDPQWLNHARRDMGGRRDRRLLDLARNVLDG